MKYCSKCGKELMDEAVICVNCGCAVAPNATTGSRHSANYPKIVEYEESLKSPFVLSVIGVVLCLGIGIIFAIISLCMLKKVTVPQLENLTVEDQAALMKAQSKHKKIGTMSAITFLMFAIAFALGMIIGAIVAVS